MFGSGMNDDENVIKNETDENILFYLQIPFSGFFALTVSVISLVIFYDDILEKEWKEKTSDDDVSKTIDRLVKCESLVGFGIRSYNILLIGVIGAGKSSLCNTFVSLFAGKCKTPATLGETTGSSVTNRLQWYTLGSTDTRGCVNIIDMRGYAPERTFEHELEHLLNGKLPTDYVVASELLQVPGVTSVGYKLARLSLFLDDSMDMEDRQRTEHNLKFLLKKQNISRYEFYYEQKELKQYAEVGSSLKIGGRTGARGGFATLGQQKKLCVLLSRHISLQGNYVLVEDPPKSGQLKSFATCISQSGPLDIAIAQVTKEPEYCQKQFRDEYGKCLPSSICLFDDLKWLYRLPVHISRASNSTGLGIIIIPVLAMDDAQGIYLKIEDRDPKERFANPGDSGAIICANDIEQGSKVHTIAMLIGSPNDEKVNTNSQTKRQYVAFRLINGVVQLQKELNEDINLY